MGFDLSILDDDEREEALNIASEISMSAMALDFDKVKIQLDSIQEIFDSHKVKIENRLRKEEHNNFLSLIKDEEGQKTLEVPKHRNSHYWPIFRNEIMVETAKAFGIRSLEATEEEKEIAMAKFKKEALHFIPKSKIIIYQGLYFVPTLYCENAYVDKFKSNYKIKTVSI